MSMSSTWIRFVAAIVAFSVGNAAPTSAFAAPPPSDATSADTEGAAMPDVELAKKQLAIGQQLYDRAEHKRALVAFEAAYEAYPLPEFRYNIGLCHERLGHTAAAIESFQSYLDGSPDAADRESVEHRIAVLRSKATADRDPDITALALDPIEAMPWPKSTPRATVPPPAMQPPATDTPTNPGRPMIAGGAITFALGIAIGVGGGLAFGLPATRKSDEIDAALADDPAPEDRRTMAQARSIAREGDRLLALQYASIGVGAVMLATGIGLMIAGKRRQKRKAATSAWLAPTPSGVSLAGRF